MKHFICYPYIAVLSGLLFAFPLCLKAQQSFTIKGIVVKSQENKRLAQVRIADLNTHEVKQTDDYGMFTIAAHLGDTLEFSKPDYTVYKQAVASSNDLVVYLQPILNLNTVVIKGSSTRQDQLATLDAYRSKGVYNNGKSSVLSTIASPLNGLYDAFSKDARNAKRFNAYIKDENENALIDRRFSKSLIRQITGLNNDDELTEFINIYRPSYQDIVKWSDYDVINYTKTCWASYKTGKKTPLPKLTP